MPTVATSTFGGRHWRLLLTPAIAMPYDTGVLWMVGIGGLIASVLLATLFWSIATTRRRAVALGRQMSARYPRKRGALPHAQRPAAGAGADGARRRRHDHLRQPGRRGAPGRAHRTTVAGSTRCSRTTRCAQRLAELDGDAHWSNVDAVLHTFNGDSFWASTSIARVQRADVRQAADGRHRHLRAAPADRAAQLPGHATTR